MRLKGIIVFISCALLVACEKRKYPEEKIKLEEEEIFFRGSIGGEPIDLSIGADGYYCYSSYKQRPDSIYGFVAELKKFDCNPCPASLRVELFDYVQRQTGSQVQVDSSLRAGSRGIVPAMTKINTLKLTSFSNKVVSNVQWALSNGHNSQDTVLFYEFTKPGAQTVSLTVRTTGNCESMVVNKIFVGGENNLFACSIAANAALNNTAQFNAKVMGGKPPFRYTWNFGDGSINDSASPSHQYNYAGSYPVKLKIEDDENNICESNYIFVAGKDLSSCAVNIGLSHTGSRNALLDGVKIQWTDPSNTIFSSDKIAQPTESYFEIIDSKEYEPNERNESGRLLTLRLNILLSDGHRNMWLKSERAAIAVSYK